MKAKHRPQAQRHIRIPRKIHINLYRIGQTANLGRRHINAPAKG